jgi:ABC-2 type transport system permease protein
MKLIALITKDLKRAFINPFGLSMMFVAPLLITGLIAMAFGGAGGGDPQVSIQATRLVIANLDPGNPQAGFSAGQMLVDFLKDDSVSDLVQVTTLDDAEAAKASVMAGEQGAALVIPADFTQALISDKTSTLALYHDPTLTIGPGIVRSLVAQFVDGFSGTQIAADVTASQFAKRNLPVDDSLHAQVTQAYAAWATSVGEEGNSGDAIGLTTRPPADAKPVEDPMQGIMARIMAGMMIFFAFWTGANSALSILREDEESTLSRLFTTPTSRRTILAGKMILCALTVAIEVVVLLVLSGLLFKISWGSPLAVLLAAIGLVVVTAGFGVFIISFLKNSRQAGGVMGGALTMLAMLGGLFTEGIQNIPSAFKTLNLATPHGWALKAWNAALGPGAGPELFLSFAVLLALGALFFILGARKFSRRFA